jgi:4-diphosphocytidyl-2-C-methyl-D-erythritol kinase
MRWLALQHDVVVWAPAKVNLFLEVLGKRPDGFHAIATLLVAIRRFDRLRFKEDPSGQLRLTCNRADLATGPDNLVLRAARVLKERTGCSRGADIRLVKRIPMAAGLAGGSADAAATLLGLNRLWQLGVSAADLEELGATLGSDVPFFFHLPAAWCTGRGEIVAPIAVPRALDLVLVCPNFGCPTAEVYRRVQVPQTPVDGAELRAALTSGDIDVVGRLLHNRLQPAAESLAPQLVDLERRIAALPPAGTLLSGSGSTLFALCRDRDDARRVATELGRHAQAKYDVSVTRTLVQ